MSILEGFFKAKILALFHDPPNKPWIITGRCKAHDFMGNEFKERHEQEAAWLVSEVFGRELLEYMRGSVFRKIYSKADRLAASVDRWILNLVTGGDSKFQVGEVEVRNIFNPQKSFKTNFTLNDNGMKDYAEKLKELVKAASNNGKTDIRFLYHILYSSVEYYFYRVFEKAVGPADTRSPSHSIFDHLAATAMMINWVWQDDLSRQDALGGYLVGIDLAGVQGFISGSRKLRDLWISSWIASALAWASMKEFVEKLGPDILILPSARNNPFYFHMLLLKAKDKKELKDKLEELRGWFNYDSSKGPIYPVIPVTLDLALPRFEILKKMNLVDSEDGLVKKIVSGYIESWKLLFNKVKESILKELEVDGGKLLEAVKMAFKEAEDLGVDKLPPLMMRVSVIDVAKEVGNEQDPALYHRLFIKLMEAMRELSNFRVNPAIYLNLTKWTEEKCHAGSYSECTVCGRLPALLELSSDESEFKETVPSRWRVYFDPGEKLCGYCLLKRCAAIRFDAAVEALLGPIDNEVSPPYFTSTSDIALQSFKEQLTSLLSAIVEGKVGGEEIKGHIAKCVDATFKEIVATKDALLQIPMIASRREKFMEDNRELHGKLDEKLLDEAATFYALPSGVMFRMARGELRALERVLSRILGRGELTVYYAIINADADNMGNLLSGEVSTLLKLRKDCGKEELANAVSSYLSSLISDKKIASMLRNLIETAAGNEEAEEKKKKMMQVLSATHGKATMNDVEKIYNLLEMILKERRIILSPAFHVTLSRALMVSALKDCRKVEEFAGVTVYAGGDDLLAVVPAKNGLRLVAETRKLFEGEYDGFHLVERGVVAAISDVGKSYSVVFAHHMHPLHSVLRATRHSMKEVSKEAEWVDGGRVSKKDTCAVVFLPRGADKGDEALLPLHFKQCGWAVEKAEELAESIVERRVSHSLLRDILDEKNAEAIAWLAKERNEAAKLLIERIIKRNMLGGQQSELAETLCETLRTVYRHKEEHEERTRTPLTIMITRSASFYLNARFRW